MVEGNWSLRSNGELRKGKFRLCPSDCLTFRLTLMRLE